jgi:hypothetical protein
MRAEESPRPSFDHFMGLMTLGQRAMEDLEARKRGLSETRGREDTVKALRTARQHLLSFLL